jgi:hypothetical protein
MNMPGPIIYGMNRIVEKDGHSNKFQKHLIAIVEWLTYFSEAKNLLKIYRNQPIFLFFNWDKYVFVIGELNL